MGLLLAFYRTVSVFILAVNDHTLEYTHVRFCTGLKQFMWCIDEIVIAIVVAAYHAVFEFDRRDA